MADQTNNQALNGLNPLAYLGVNPKTPPNFSIRPFPPTQYDSKNVQVGALWLNTGNANPPTTAPSINDLYVLVALYGGLATWLPFSSGVLESLTGNTGGAVHPTANNINVVGDGTTITIAGNPGTSTLTASVVGTGVLSTLTGNSGGAVSPLAGNINVVGTGVITVVGNPGTHTLTVTPSGSIASSFITNPATGTATPVAGVLTFAGAGGITVSAGGSTVTITGGSSVAESFPTDSGTATPAANVLNILAQNATLGAGSSVLFSAPGPSNTVQLNVTDASSNTIIGNNAGNLTLTATNSVGLGKTVLHALTSGANNTVAGSLSGALITSGTSNSIYGEGSATALLTGSSNVIVGRASGNNLTGAESNNVLISSAGITGASGLIQVSLPTYGRWMHNYPGFGNAANGENIYIGTNAGSLTTNNTTTGNIGIGGAALQSIQNSVGGNIAIGDVGLFYLTTGIQNTCVGKDVGVNAGGGTGITTGSYNSLFGFTAGLSYTGAESSNVLINSQGVVGDNNTFRVGYATGAGTSQLNKTFIHGIRGITTGVNDAIAVLVDSAGQLGTVSSSIRYKDNVESMDEESSPLMQLRPVTFTWKHDSSNKRNFGLIAEEVEEIMPQLVVYDKEGKPETVKYHDLPVLILNELQKLSDRVRELEEKIEELEFN